MYLTPIKWLAADNLPGILALQIVRKADVLSMPAPTARTIFGNITLKPGAGFTNWEVTVESVKIETRKNITREGSTARNTLPFSIPKDRPEIRAMLDRMEADEFIVVFRYPSGQQKVMGTLQAPARFSYEHDSGGEFTSRNAYDCQFYYSGPDNIYFYPGTVNPSPGGPAPGVVNLNGLFWFQVQPGQTVNIESDFDFNDLQITP